MNEATSALSVFPCPPGTAGTDEAWSVDGTIGTMSIRLVSPHGSARGPKPAHPAPPVRACAGARRRRGTPRFGCRTRGPDLARISHQLTAADADLAIFAALNAVRVLNVLSSTPARPNSRSPCENSHLHALASRSGEKCGLNTRVGDGFGPVARKMSTGVAEHVPAMAAEVVEVLAPRADGRYVDCTFGRGGHARAILERLGPSARVLALDRDPQAVDAARELARSDPRVSVRHACFGELGRIVHAAGLTGRVDGVLMDLGVSSPQLDQPERGFSFAHDGPLDLRMDPGAGVPASQWLASATASEIERVLRAYGEERAARRIARALVAERERGAPIASTRRLAAVVAKAVRGRARTRIHPATRTFQAIRVHVNDELGELERGLSSVPNVLVPGGRLVVISFHSLEDRIVKRFMRGPGATPASLRHLPVAGEPRAAGVMTPLSRARRPGAAEVAANPRVRSAVLRVAERSR